MESKIQNQNEVELAKLFQVEELEERMEFGKWTASAGTSTDTSTGATTINTTASFSF